MRANIFTGVSILLALAGSAFGVRNDVSKSSNGVGCTGTVASHSTGFNAYFHDYVGGDLIDFGNNDWVANSYTTRSIYASATGVNIPNFSITDNELNADLPNYNLTDVDIYSTVLELKGYYVGMYSRCSIWTS